MSEHSTPAEDPCDGVIRETQTTGDPCNPILTNPFDKDPLDRDPVSPYQPIEGFTSGGSLCQSVPAPIGVVKVPTITTATISHLVDIIPIFGCMDSQASNYDSDANTDDGSCIYLGCMDPASSNYDANANVDDGSCIVNVIDLMEAKSAFGSPNLLPTGGQSHSLGANHGMAAYPLIAGQVVFGGHTTKNAGANLPSVGVFSECWAFPVNVVAGTTYNVNWSEIVLALRNQGTCSDCLMGGWWLKVRTAPAGCIETAPGVWSNACGDTGTGSIVNGTFFDGSTNVYDPVSLNELTYANSLYHNSLQSTNLSSNSGGTNTAGASNGSYSEWVSKTASFTASATETVLLMMAVTTNWTECVSCFEYAGNSKWGVYMGITGVSIG